MAQDFFLKKCARKHWGATATNRILGFNIWDSGSGCGISWIVRGSADVGCSQYVPRVWLRVGKLGKGENPNGQEHGKSNET